MPRRPNTRPTTIYWLIDMRPETIAKGWPQGYPFYCGKTVFDPYTRLDQHFSTASRPSKRPVCRLLRDYGRQFVRIHTVEFLPTSENWEARERFWIAHLRKRYPGCANVCDGGQGLPGYVPPRRRRARKPRPLKKPDIVYRPDRIVRPSDERSIMKRFTKGSKPKRQDKSRLADIRAQRVAERKALLDAHLTARRQLGL